MDKNKSCRRTQVGGQAVIEGVMMKNGTKVALAVRKDDGTIEIKNSEFHPKKEKHKWLGWPLIRGIVGFVESLMLSFRTLSDSTDMLGLEDENEKKDGKSSTSGLMVISLILGLLLAVGLFIFLPSFLSGLLMDNVFHLTEAEHGWKYQLAISGLEGAVKIIIFIGYLLFVSLMKDIRRTFQYHGAEHKSIACYENGMELTPENARKCKRFHPRCGTSFMFVMVLLSIVIGIFIPTFGGQEWLRSLVKLATLPLVMGLGYEFIMFAGKHQNWFTKMLSAPGLWMQRITTKEPDDYQLAVAICAIKASMPEEFPDFSPEEYFITREQNKGHIAYEEPKKEKGKSKEKETENTSEE
ncbi:MAG: DUF1385 domain-containing protein [Clostridia bacterium]|nr:DUF1385 domain-containing protein [Clostridia bacterium]